MNEWLWYLTRAAGLVGLVLLSGSVVLGLLGAGRAGGAGAGASGAGGAGAVGAGAGWGSGAVRTALHRSIALVTVVGVAVHVLTAVVETYVSIGWVSLVLPFSSSYDRFWVGLGTLAFDLLLIVTATSLLRHRIGARAWRLVHWVSYAMWPVAVAHGLGAATTDTGVVWVTSVACVVAVAGTAVWRAGRLSLDTRRRRSVAALGWEVTR